jgi:hypothetical protein
MKIWAYAGAIGFRWDGLGFFCLELDSDLGEFGLEMWLGLLYEYVNLKWKISTLHTVFTSVLDKIRLVSFLFEYV